MSSRGSLVGGILMIAGSTIGAGMLALPVITGPGGFLAGLFFFGVAWIFMTLTAFALLEVNCRLGYEYSLITLTEKTLGKKGKALAWALFLFLFYSLGVAYISASGSLVESLIWELTGLSLPAWVASLGFTLLFGAIVHRGAKAVDHLNRALMVGLIISYLALILLGLPHIQGPLLMRSNWSYALLALPILVISFGFHNMIPSLAEYFKGDLTRLRVAILIGSACPLVIYILFELVILGIVPLGGEFGLIQALKQGQSATWSLEHIIGKSVLSFAADAFALFAITTSFLTQSLSLVDFLADGLKVSKERQGRVLLVLLALSPPLLFSFLYPGIFIKALNFAGSYCAVVLFGAIPALMVWKLKSWKVPHGASGALLALFRPPLLIGLILFSAFIFFFELFKVDPTSLPFERL